MAIQCTLDISRSFFLINSSKTSHRPLMTVEYGVCVLGQSMTDVLFVADVLNATTCYIVPRYIED